MGSLEAGSLKGRVAIVTGAGQGLGRSHALALAAEGAAVLVNDVDAGMASATVHEIREAGGEAEGDGIGLSTVAHGAALVERAVESLGRVDIVVNNAGISRPSPAEDLDDPGLDLHLGVHLRATVGTTAAALPLMRAQGYGRVINTVSGHGLEPLHPHSAAYAAAKAAVFGFTRAAALEVGEGTTVNAVAPLAYTRMSEAYLSRIEGAEARYAAKHVSLVVVWLCSQEWGGVNGHVLRVEGEMIGAYKVQAGPLVAFDRVSEIL